MKSKQLLHLEDIILSHKFSYKKILDESFLNLKDNDKYFINVIIGCRGRGEFLNPLINSFNNAIKNVEKKITLTIVEHNNFPEHKKKIPKDVNYIWTKGFIDGQFNKSLAFNFGVKYGNDAEYYLLHDLDILVKDNFFQELIQNINNCSFLQPFGKRRILYMSKELTNEYLEEKIQINDLNEKLNGAEPSKIKNPKGGSVFISKDLFEEVGGFDPEMFWGYAAEDQFFWEKVKTISEIKYADNPPIDMFHMWHEPAKIHENPFFLDMEDCWNLFKALDKKEKIEIIKLKKMVYKEEI